MGKPSVTSLSKAEIDMIDHDLFSLNKAITDLADSLRIARLGEPNLVRINTIKGITQSIIQWWNEQRKELS